MSKLVEHRSLWSGLTSEADDAEIGVLGVPFDNAVSWRGGTRHAPQRIRSITPHLGFTTEPASYVAALPAAQAPGGELGADLNEGVLTVILQTRFPTGRSRRLRV